MCVRERVRLKINPQWVAESSEEIFFFGWWGGVGGGEEGGRVRETCAGVDGAKQIGEGECQNG